MILSEIGYNNEKNKKMKKIIFLFLSILAISCNQKKLEDSTPIKPSASGKAGEIVVVAPDKQWDNHVGDTIFYTLSQPFPILPQDEAFFDVIHIDPSSFKSVFKTHRNIIFININKSYKKPKVTFEKDRWANSQLIYNFYAPDTASFYKLWQAHSKKLINAYFNKEIKSYQNAFESDLNLEVIKTLKQKYHIYLAIPSTYNLDVKKPHFAWLSRETAISSQGILIYDYPYTDKNTFTTNYLIAKRDEITKKNVPGPNPGTYMQTEKRVPIISEKINLNGQYAILLRGLWYTKNYFLGGPFVSITTLDKKRNRIVTVDAYVYAGKQKKKLYMWQVEAIIRTLKITD